MPDQFVIHAADHHIGKFRFNLEFCNKKVPQVQIVQFRKVGDIIQMCSGLHARSEGRYADSRQFIIRETDQASCDILQRFQKKRTCALHLKERLFTHLDSAAQISYGPDDSIGVQSDADHIFPVRIQCKLFTGPAVAQFRFSAGNQQSAFQEIAYRPRYRGIVAIHLVRQFDPGKGIMLKQEFQQCQHITCFDVIQLQYFFFFHGNLSML